MCACMCAWKELLVKTQGIQSRFIKIGQTVRGFSGKLQLEKLCLLSWEPALNFIHEPAARVN